MKGISLALFLIAIPLISWATTSAFAAVGYVSGDGSFGLPLGILISLILVPFALRYRSLQRRKRDHLPPTSWDSLTKWLLRLDVIVLSSVATFVAVCLPIVFLVGSITPIGAGDGGGFAPAIVGGVAGLIAGCAAAIYVAYKLFYWFLARR